MKKQLITIAVALLTAGTLTTSCSSEDNIIETPQTQQPATNTITLTATLAPKGGASRDQSGTRSGFGEAQPALGEAKDDNGGQTRAITTGKDGENKEILNVAWQKDEQIAIYYEKNNGDYATAMATVGTPNADGSAPITASLTDAKGGTAKLIYPYSLAHNGELKTGAGSPFRSQDGTLEYISQNLDAATATTTIDVTGGTATLNGPVTMQNQVCICKFNFSGMFPDATENYYKITIREKQGNSTTNTYEANSIARASMGAVYMALLGAENKDFKFSVQGLHKSSATDENAENKNYYEVNSSNVTLTAGKFYRRIPVVLADIIYSTVTIPEDGTYTLDNRYIFVTSGHAIQCEGDATIILSGKNNVWTSDVGKSAIFVPNGKTLTIQGTGSLVAKATGEGGVGIGGDCGHIVIESGIITAMGGNYAAGIGSGSHCSCGDITISGGKVTATGGLYGAGIGSGESGYCGVITICGGTVTATGGLYGAGIGSGWAGTCCNIYITDHAISVTATMGDIAQAPIGNGYSGSCPGVSVDNESEWSGSATKNFYFASSIVTDAFNNDVTRWTLTHK